MFCRLGDHYDFPNHQTTHHATAFTGQPNPIPIFKDQAKTLGWKRFVKCHDCREGKNPEIAGWGTLAQRCTPDPDQRECMRNALHHGRPILCITKCEKEHMYGFDVDSTMTLILGRKLLVGKNSREMDFF